MKKEIYITTLLSCALLNLYAINALSARDEHAAITWKWDSITTQCKNDNNWTKEKLNLHAEYFGNLYEVEMNRHTNTGVLDSTILIYELTDSDHLAIGDDGVNNNIDAVDFVYLATHGGVDDTYGTTEWHVTLTDSLYNNNSCRAFSTHMWVGDNDAEFVASTACHSAQFDLIATGRYEVMDDDLHQWAGYHGTSNARNHDQIDDFAEDAWTSAGSAAYAWIENMTEWDVPGWKWWMNDLCAVVVVQGNNASSAQTRTDYEDYSTSSQYSDPDSTPHQKQLFYCNCDPPGGGPLVCN